MYKRVMNINIFIMLLLFLFQSCSSKRVYEKPNFNLVGSDAKNEIEKFSLSFINIHRGGFSDESPLRTFSTQDFQPLMKQISPQSIKMLEETKIKEMIGWGVLAFGLSTLFIKDSDGNNYLYWWGVGSILGYGVYISIERDKVSDQFNEDLNRKFNMTVGYRFQFN